MDLAQISGLSPRDVEDAEDPNSRTPIRTIEKIAQVLALDDRIISYRPQAGGDQKLAVRLREINASQQPFSRRLVSQLCEAAWVIKKQYELNSWLNPDRSSPIDSFEPSPNYGERGYPAWLHGYFLARETRKVLGIPIDEPIENLHDLIERHLGIAVVQLDLPQTLAGATIASDSARGIAVNEAGLNANVWIRRMTLAHELGHLLWDPDDKLHRLQVDQYTDLDESPWQQEERRNYVEARANAFAVELLAPQQAAVRVFEEVADSSFGLRKVMVTFGLSYTSARHHIWNGVGRRIPPEQLIVEDFQATDDWTGRESYTVDFFKPHSVPISRRGWFAELVVRAAGERLISEESAAAYLKCTPDDYKVAAEFVRDLSK